MISLYISAVHAVCPAPGSGIVANGTTTTDSGCTITTSANVTPGAFALNAGVINLSNSSITTTGSSSFGARASGAGSVVNLSDVTIQTSGSLADGLFADAGGHIVMNGGSITTTGFSARGADALAGSEIDLTNVTINSSGSGAGGLFTVGGDITATGCTITVNSTSSGSGIFAQNGGNITLNNSTLVSTGTLAATRALSNATLNINGSSITSIGNNNYGLFADQTSVANVANSTIQTSGNFSFGTYVQGGSILNLDSVDITTSGINAYGLIAINNAQANGENVHIHTTGTNSFGVIVVSGAQGGSTATLDNSTVETSGLNASAIVFTFSSPPVPPVGAVNTLNATNTEFSADDATLIVVDSGSSSVNTNNATINFNNVTANAAANHDFLLVDSDARLVMNAVDSELSGDTVINAGGTANLNYQNTHYTGAITTNGIGNLTLTGGTWDLTGTSNLTNLTNAGSINFTPNGTNFKTLTIDDAYIGQGGNATLNTFLEGTGSPSDLIIINGGTATGSTALNIRNAGGAGAVTIGNGILVVDAINGGTTAPTAFTQGGDIVAGPFEYTLYRGGVDGSDPDDWFLRSILPGPPDPDDPIPVPPGFIPNIRPIISLDTVIPSLGLLYGEMITDTLHQRVGMEEQILCDPNLNCKPFFNGVWARAIGKNGNWDSSGFFRRGPDFDYDFRAVQAGLDIYRHKHCNGSTDFVGVFGAYGYNSGDATSFFNYRAGTDFFDAYTAGAYWTHFGARGWYLDGIAQGTWDKFSATNVRDDHKFKTNAKDWGASLEAGYPLRFIHGFTLQPQGQIAYQRLVVDDAQDLNVDVRFNNSSATAGRLGGMLNKDWCLCWRGIRPQMISTWVSVNAWHRFQGDSRTLFSSSIGYIPFNSRIGGSWMDYGVGISAKVIRNGTLYATYNRQELFNGGRGFANEGEVGVRINI